MHGYIRLRDVTPDDCRKTRKLKLRIKIEFTIGYCSRSPRTVNEKIGTETDEVIKSLVR